jgi:alanine dehydrogenase
LPTGSSQPIFLRNADVEALLEPADAIDVAEEALSREIAEGRVSLPLDGGQLIALPGVDPELRVAVVRAEAGFAREGSRAVVLVLASDQPELIAVVEADALTRLGAAAAAGVAVRRLARAEAGSLGVIGCGGLASAFLACVRAALPSVELVSAYCPDAERLAAFCREQGAEAAAYGRDSAEQDVVAVATTSRDPVLRGEWLRPGALVCALGATRSEARELDNVVLERAGFVCCDSVAQARLAAGDLIEPVARGVLDWLEVHGLAQVITGEVAGRQGDDDIVLYKGVGAAALDLALAVRAIELAA